jgi:integrase
MNSTVVADVAKLAEVVHELTDARASEIQKRYIKPLGIKLGLGPIGWHTFRHTYRSWLDETGAPMKVQQELMRHASIQTTMNVYGQATPSSKREANGKVVEMVLKPTLASA